MNDATNAVETAVETEAASGPQIVAIRKGSKGPGKEVVIVATAADAAKVKADLDQTVDADQTVIIRQMPTTVVKTYDEWAEAQSAVAERQAAIEAAKSKLTPEEFAAILGSSK